MEVNRITMDDIKDQIVAEYITTADKALAGCPIAEGLERVTLCVVALRNGTKIVGINYGAIDPQQHDPILGEQEARANALDQIWPLLGYQLRTQRMGRPPEVDVPAPAEPKIIPPTVGRRVWYWPDVRCAESGFARHDHKQPLDSGIAYVWHDRMVNISVADQNGVVHSRTSVMLLQEGDVPPAHGGFCQWMPYQLGQAKK